MSAASHGGEAEHEDGGGEGERGEGHGEVLGVADAEVAGEGADDGGDECRGGHDAEGFEPEAGDGAGGAGELEGGEGGEAVRGTPTVPPITATACSCLRSFMAAPTSSRPR